MNEKQAKSIIAQLFKRAKEAKWKCLYPNCEKDSIQSHLLQKNGILSTISVNRHVHEIRFVHNKKERYEVKLIGLNEAFTFPGFCISHDTSLFEKIENGNKIDFNDYHTQLLFSYRALVNEKRKKEIMVNFYNRILESNELKHFVNEDYITNLNTSTTATLEGLADKPYYEELFLHNIENTERRDFFFITRTLNRIEICSSAVFTFETSLELRQMQLARDPLLKLPLTGIFFNLLPTKDKSYLVIGCLKERLSRCKSYLLEFESCTEERLLQLISNILLAQVENWLFSTEFYNSKLKSKERGIISIINQTTKHPNERREIPLNIFN